MNQQALAKRLKKEVNWNHFFSLVHAIGKSLDGPKHRFIKSDLLEMAIDAYSTRAIKWVDELGWDHEVDGRIKIEMKHSVGSLYTPGGKRKSHVKEIRMQNTLGGGASRKLSKTFDYLLLTDLQCAAIVAYKTVEKATKAIGDVVKIGSGCLPVSKVTFIVQPADVLIRRVQMPALLDTLRTQCGSYVNRVKHEYDRRGR